MKKILILEDNPVTREHLKMIIQELDIKNVLFSFENVVDAYHCAIEKMIDLFIVDIILDTKHPGDSSGLRYIENIRKVKEYEFTPVIIVTALEDAKLVAYESLHCYSYLEKPFEVEAFKQLIVQCMRFPGKTIDNKILYFQKEGVILSVKRKDITYAESKNRLLYIHTIKDDVLNIPYYTLKRLLEEIDSSDFLQCSRSTIFNKQYVGIIDFANRYIQLRDGLGEIEIGMMYKKLVKESLQ